MCDSNIRLITSTDMEVITLMEVKYQFLFFAKCKTKNVRTLLTTLLP